MSSLIDKRLNDIEMFLEKRRKEWVGADEKTRELILQEIKPYLAQRDILNKVLEKRRRREKEAQEATESDETMHKHVLSQETL